MTGERCLRDAGAFESVAGEHLRCTVLRMNHSGKYFARRGEGGMVPISEVNADSLPSFGSL